MMPSRRGYVARAVREFYSDLKDVKHDNPTLTEALEKTWEKMSKPR